MKKTAKVVFALIVTVLAAGYSVSCSSKTETANSDVTDIDTTAAAPETDTTALPVDTTDQALDTAASK